MVVTCPYCGGIFSVKRVVLPSIYDDFPSFDDNGVKNLAEAKDISLFFCSDCGREFTSEGITMMEKIKFT
jgi:DNA-directed RNA polymerase subunit RPC12/RpoP